MHLFLYQAARHKATKSTWGGSTYRFKQGTIRGDFDLELLKKGIKGRYKILPHGEHPFQQALKKVGLEQEFYGHVVQIDDAKNAIWFKLNYDQVGKKETTKYIGGWRDLDPEAIEDMILEYQTLSAYQHQVQSNINQIRYARSALSSFGRGVKNPLPALDPSLKASQEFTDVLEVSFAALEVEASRSLAKITAVQDKVKAYIAERKY